MAGNGGVIGPPNTVTAICQSEVIHTKTSSGTFTTAANTTSINAVIVAGGGGGGNGSGSSPAGGGGAGAGGARIICSIPVSG